MHRWWIAGVVGLALGLGMSGNLGAQDDLRTQLDLFGQVLSLVQSQYVDPVDNEKLIKGAIDGMLSTLDPHSVYMPADRYEQFSENFKANYSGIGINFDIRDGKLIVISPLEGTPAFKLGIRAADRIVAIDGKDVPPTVNNNDVFKQLRGPEGSIVHVSIERENVDHRIEFDIARARIPQESVPYAFMIRPGVGYIRITRFASATGDELEAKLEQLKAAGHEGAAARPALQLGRPAQPGRRGERPLPELRPEDRLHARPRAERVERLLRHRPRQVHRLPDDRARRPRLGVGVGDHRRRAAGHRPRPGRRRDHVRQGPGPEPDAPEEQLGAAADDREVLHAERPPDPARLQLGRQGAVPGRGVLARRRGRLGAGEAPEVRDHVRPHGLRRRRHPPRRARAVREPDRRRGRPRARQRVLRLRDQDRRPGPREVPEELRRVRQGLQHHRSAGRGLPEVRGAAQGQAHAPSR